MSRIYFTSRSDESEVWGGERAHLDILCQRIALAALPSEFGTRAEEPHPLLRVAPDCPDWLAQQLGPVVRHDEGMNRDAAARRFFSSAGFMSSACKVVFGGETHDATDLLANTALVTGEIPALMAKIHWTCESHGWIRQEWRSWFADLIQRGLDNNFLRRWVYSDSKPTGYSIGWPETIELLRKPNDGPVFMSYSVCDHFASYPPESWTAPAEVTAPQEEDDPDGLCVAQRREEAWYELPFEDRFAICAEDMATNHAWLEINGASLQGQGFMSGKTLWDLVASPEWEGRAVDSTSGEKSGVSAR